MKTATCKGKLFKTIKCNMYVYFPQQQRKKIFGQYVKLNLTVISESVIISKYPEKKMASFVWNNPAFYHFK